MIKICPRCGDSNKDLDIYCKSCACSLTKTHKNTKKEDALKIEEDRTVKICPACGASNAKFQILCMECSHSLGDVNPVSSNELWQEQSLKIEKRENTQKLWVRIATFSGIGFSLGLFIVLMFMGGNILSFLFGIITILLAVLNLNFPEEMFKFSHMFSIREVELTDFYYVTNTIGSIIGIMMGLGIMIFSLIAS